MWQAKEPRKVTKGLKYKVNTYDKTGHLNYVNRVLLAVLYLHADACGVVKGLGMSDLGKYAGILTKDQLESQLEKMTRLGYICARVSGVTGRYMFGRSNGAFFLNVFNDELTSNISAPILCMLHMPNSHLSQINPTRIIKRRFELDFMKFESLVKQQKYINYLANEDYINTWSKNVKIIKDKDQIIELLEMHPVMKKKGFMYISWLTDINIIDREFLEKFTFPSLSFLFSDMISNHQINFINYKINYYASSLLSGYWNEIENEFKVIDSLLNSLTAELFPDGVSERILKEFPNVVGDLLMEAMALYIYRLIFETALLTKGLVQTFLEPLGKRLNLDEAEYTILPTPYTDKWANVAVVIKLREQSCNTRIMTLTLSDHDCVQKNYSDLMCVKEEPWLAFKFNLEQKLS